MKQSNKTLAILVAMAILPTAVHADEAPHLSDANLSVATTICDVLQGTIEDLEFEYSTRLDRATTEGVTKTSNIYDVCRTEKLIIAFAFDGDSTHSLAGLAQASANSEVETLQPALFIVNTQDETEGLQRGDAINIAGADKYKVPYAVIATEIDNVNLYSDVIWARHLVLASVGAKKVLTPAEALQQATDELATAEENLIIVYDNYQQGIATKVEYDAAKLVRADKTTAYEHQLGLYNAQYPSSTQGVADNAQTDTTTKVISWQQSQHNKTVEIHENLHTAYFGYKYREDYVFLKDIDARIAKAHSDMEAKQRQYTAAPYGSQEKVDFARERNVLWRMRDNLKQLKAVALARFNQGKHRHQAAKTAMIQANSAVTEAENAHARAWFDFNFPIGDKAVQQVALSNAASALVAAKADRDRAAVNLAALDGALEALKTSRVEIVNTHPAYIEYRRHKSIANNLKLIVDYSRNLNLAWQGCSYLNACYSIDAFSKINWSITGSLEQAQTAIHNFNLQEQKLETVKQAWDTEVKKLLKDLPPLQ